MVKKIWERKMAATVEGSYSVEMALLFPFLLIVIFSLLYLGMYLTDTVQLRIMMETMARNVQEGMRHPVEAATGEIIFEQIGKKNNSHLFCETAGAYLKEESERRLWITSVDNVNISLGVLQIKLNVELHPSVSLYRAREFFSDAERKLAGGVLKYDPEKAVRIQPKTGREEQGS